MRCLLVVRSRRLLAHLSLTVIRSGDGGATAGGGAAAAPRGRRQRRPGGRGGSGSGASPWWMPHPERCPPSREPRPPPQGGGGDNLRRGDPSLFPRLSAQPRDPMRPGRIGSEGKKEGGCEGRLESGSSGHWGGAPRGPARKERAGGRAGGEPRSRGGASLRDAARRKQGSARWGPAGGCRAQAPGGGGAVLPEPTPPSPASPPAARSAPGGDRAGPSGLAEAGEGPHGDGFLQTRSGRNDSRGGRRGRRGACEAGASEPIVRTRAGEERRARGAGSREEAGERGERPRAPHQPVPTSSSAGQLLTLARGEPLGGRRKRSRRPLLPPPPPLPEPGGARGRRRRSSPW